jgi:predicted RNA-binding Zn-ribbon protein involved in translation (DUF1610 family)
MNKSVQVKKRLLGGYSLVYCCAMCQARLTSPLNDAGKSDNCPDCGAAFAVPGVEERERILGEQERKQAEKHRRAERAKQAKEARVRRREAERAAVRELLYKQRIREIEQQKELKHQRVTGTTQRCPICAEDILGDAKKCRHCGKFLTSEISVGAPARKAKKKTSVWVWCALGLLFLAFCSQAATETTRRATGISSSDEHLILGAAQEGVRRILKAPRTASFPSRTLNRAAYTITVHSPDSCTVSGYVDAQNSFGATLRNNWTVDCDRNGKFWFARNPVLFGP